MAKKKDIIQRLADAKTILYLNDILTDAESARAHQRILKLVRRLKAEGKTTN